MRILILELPSHDDIASSTHEVVTKQSNAYGLHDMLGNVWEWVADGFDENYYRNSPAADPPGPASGQHRVRLGGSFDNFAGHSCHLPFRLPTHPLRLRRVPLCLGMIPIPNLLAHSLRRAAPPIKELKPERDGQNCYANIEQSV